MTTKYEVTFSNGFTLKRNSKREYGAAYCVTTERGSYGGFSRTVELAEKSARSDNTRFHGGEGEVEIKEIPSQGEIT